MFQKCLLPMIVLFSCNLLNGQIVYLNSEGTITKNEDQISAGQGSPKPITEMSIGELRKDILSLSKKIRLHIFEKLSTDSAIQDELNLTDFQLERIRKSFALYDNAWRDFEAIRVRKESSEELQKAKAYAIEMQAKYQRVAEEALVKAQIDAIEELSFVVALERVRANYKPTEVGLASVLIDSLGLDEIERSELEKKLNKIDENLKREIDDARLKTSQTVLDHIPAKHKKMFEVFWRNGVDGCDKINRQIWQQELR